MTSKGSYQTAYAQAGLTIVVKLIPVLKKHVIFVILTWIFIYLTMALNSSAYRFICKNLTFLNDTKICRYGKCSKISNTTLQISPHVKII